MQHSQSYSSGTVTWRYLLPAHTLRLSRLNVTSLIPVQDTSSRSGSQEGAGGGESEFRARAR
jgi:hypothetical protein